MLGRNISDLDRNFGLNQLHELWDGILPVIGWVIELLGLYCRVVLCDNGFDCSDGCLRGRELFPFHIERMYMLFCRVILCDDRP